VPAAALVGLPAVPLSLFLCVVYGWRRLLLLSGCVCAALHGASAWPRCAECRSVSAAAVYMHMHSAPLRPQVAREGFFFACAGRRRGLWVLAQCYVEPRKQHSCWPTFYSVCRCKAAYQPLFRKAAALWPLSGTWLQKPLPHRALGSRQGRGFFSLCVDTLRVDSVCVDTVCADTVCADTVCVEKQGLCVLAAAAGGAEMLSACVCCVQLLQVQ
jgi:hypothetical protein